jgi:hypothetical protein
MQGGNHYNSFTTHESPSHEQAFIFNTCNYIQEQLQEEMKMKEHKV